MYMCELNPCKKAIDLFLGVRDEVNDILEGLDFIGLFDGDINVTTEFLFDPVQELVGLEDVHPKVVLEVGGGGDPGLELVENLLGGCRRVVWWGLEELFGRLED